MFYISFCNLILINYTENTSNFFLEKDLLIKESLYFYLSNSKEIYFYSESDLLVCSLSLKYPKAKRTHLSQKIWAVRKYNFTHCYLYFELNTLIPKLR